tara:strand:+ start:401 stop:763 length:363 start_codon:yes stop_codon:yes gene_type:complete
MNDLISGIKVNGAGVESFTSAGNTVGFDRRGFESVAFIGSVATADTAGLILQEADTQGGTYTDVAADQQFGVIGVIALDGEIKVGYTGYKRFVRLSSGTASGSVVTVVAILGHPSSAPQA